MSDTTTTRRSGCRRGRRRLAAFLVVTGAMLGVGLGTTPAQASTGGCVEFNPTAPSSELSVGVGVGPVSVGSSFARNPFRLCARMTRSGSRVTSVGYSLSTGFWDLVPGDRLCDFHVDVDLWHGPTNSLYFHSQGSVVWWRGWARPNCYDNTVAFRATRTAGLPVALRPGTAICVALYRNTLLPNTPPQLAARTCTSV